jgi:hypothetical protein
VESDRTAEDPRLQTLSRIGQKIGRDNEHLAAFKDLQVRDRILQSRDPIGPPHDLGTQRVVPFQLAIQPLRGRRLPSQDGHRMSAVDDANSKFVTDPMWRRENYAPPFGNGLVEETDGFMQCDLVQDRCLRNAAVERCE